jgi:hypothetical protein
VLGSVHALGVSELSITVGTAMIRGATVKKLKGMVQEYGNME